VIALVDVYEHGGRPKREAVGFLFDLIAQRMTEPEVNISAAMPSWDEHRLFVERMPFRFWYLITVPDQDSVAWAGYVSATRRNEIGIVLLKTHRGQGYGAQAVRMLMDEHQPLPAVPSERRGRWIANVNPQNEHSKHLFADKLGGRLIQNTYEL
jgi:RimJ/RimL family protein N-acetyltransferase